MSEKIAIQGVRGSYSEEATLKICGGAARIVECTDFAETFQTLLAGGADYAVVPFENKIVGRIETPNQLLRAHDLKIYEKLELKVRHVLAGGAGAEIENVQTVRSHTEALKQCRRFLSENKHWTQVIGADTASSVRRIVEENRADAAAIGSRRAAEIYGAKILAENIADDADNWTTFYLIGNRGDLRF